jgi:hypothetical protein
MSSTGFLVLILSVQAITQLANSDKRVLEIGSPTERHMKTGELNKDPSSGFTEFLDAERQFYGKLGQNGDT